MVIYKKENTSNWHKLGNTTLNLMETMSTTTVRETSLKEKMKLYVLERSEIIIYISEDRISDRQ